MDPYKANDSLDEQVNSVFRQRPKMGLFKRAVTAVTLLATSLAGCIRYDLGYVPSPDDMARQVSAYQTNLANVAASMNMYDSAIRTYDAAKVKAEAKKQLEKDASGKYVNLPTYTLDQLLATKKALDILTEKAAKVYQNENDPQKKKDRQKECKELYDLENDYKDALKWYHANRAAQRSVDKVDRQRDILTLEVFAYGAQDFDRWGKLARARSKLGKLTDPDEYSGVALWYPDKVRRAHGVYDQRVEGRKKWWKKNWWWVTLLTAGGGIYAATHGEEGEIYGNGEQPSDIGGETGGVGGR